MRPRRTVHHLTHHTEWALKTSWDISKLEARGAKIGLLKGRVRSRALTSKVGVPEGIWACGSGVKSIHMKYECSSSLVLIEHRTDAARHRGRSPKSYLCLKDWKWLKMYYRDTMVSALHNPWALWPKRATLWHIGVSQVSVPRRVSRATSFGMRFSRTVLGGTGVPALRSSPHVVGCYIDPLSSTVSVNDMAWAQECQCLDRT